MNYVCDRCGSKFARDDSESEYTIFQLFDSAGKRIQLCDECEKKLFVWILATEYHIKNWYDYSLVSKKVDEIADILKEATK